MKAFQLLCAFAGGSICIFLFQITETPVNGVVVAVNAFFAAYGATWLVARLRGRAEKSKPTHISLNR